MTPHLRARVLHALGALEVKDVAVDLSLLARMVGEHEDLVKFLVGKLVEEEALVVDALKGWRLSAAERENFQREARQTRILGWVALAACLLALVLSVVLGKH